MASIVQNLTNRGLIRPPSFLPDNIQFEIMGGSVSYGVSKEDKSDIDIVGFCIPTKELIFPHLTGEIPGFGQQIQRFENWQQHHIDDIDKRKNYDCTIYSIVRYFQLCMENNPNMIDSLFVDRDCIIHSTQIGEIVRENRKIFLHKGSFHKFKGYAYSQVNKLSSKTYQKGGNRAEDVEKYGFSTKFAYHVLRLIDECEQILLTGDLDLRRNREQLKACRRGEIPEEEIRAIFNEKEKYLEKCYEESKLPYGPREPEIKQLLFNCLESHYGNLGNIIEKPDVSKDTLRQIIKMCEGAL
jgi:predicted nucleotidyltransferase